MGIALPLATSVVALLFAATVVDQYLERRRPYQAVWAIGLGLYGAASFLQFLWSAGVTAEAVFRLWYLLGAMLVAAYLGAGTVYLLLGRRVGHGVMLALVLLTALGAGLALVTSLRSDISVLRGQALVSFNPETEERFYPAYVGALTAFLNSVGAAALVGGAIYSAAAFAIRRGPGHRVVSNALIAAGAIVSTLGGTLERFSLPQAHSLALLVGIVVIFAGFLVSREVFGVYRIPFRRAGAT